MFKCCIFRLSFNFFSCNNWVFKLEANSFLSEQLSVVCFNILLLCRWIELALNAKGTHSRFLTASMTALLIIF